ACDCAGDPQILDRTELILYTVLVSEVSDRAEVLHAKGPNVFPLPADFALGRRCQAAKDSQQAGFAAAVGPAHFNQATAFNREVQVLEQAARPADTTNVDGFQHYLL